MNDNATSGKEASETVDEQRARWEGANYGMTVVGGAGGGFVNVENRNYGDDAGAHVYSVEVADGAAVGCSCPHATHRGAHCKHQVAVENRPLVVASATAASASYGASAVRPVATDGGEPVERTDGDTDAETCDECGEPARGGLIDVSDTAYHDYNDLCDGCLIEFGGPGETPEEHATTGRVRPTRSEPADFGGASSGVDEL